LKAVFAELIVKFKNEGKPIPAFVSVNFRVKAPLAATNVG
jgi:hypothetical protein